MTIETSPDNATWTTAATPSFAFGDRHRMNAVTPAAGKSGVKYVRVTILSTLTPNWDVHGPEPSSRSTRTRPR